MVRRIAAKEMAVGIARIALGVHRADRSVEEVHLLQDVGLRAAAHLGVEERLIVKRIDQNLAAVDARHRSLGGRAPHRGLADHDLRPAEGALGAGRRDIPDDRRLVADELRDEGAARGATRHERNV